MEYEYITKIWSVTTLILMMEKEISEMLVYNSTLTWLITQGDFSILIQHESLYLNDCTESGYYQKQLQV
jgi:hypothetical protein